MPAIAEQRNKYELDLFTRRDHRPFSSIGKKKKFRSQSWKTSSLSFGRIPLFSQRRTRAYFLLICMDGGKKFRDEKFNEGRTAMPMLKKLKEFLDRAKISYEVYNHPLAYTAQEVAEAQHIPGKDVAKVVMLKADGSLVMAVVPASRMVSFDKVRAALGALDISLAKEDEFISVFPECEIGGMPPFGNLFGLPVYVDPALEKDETIVFNAGDHQQSVRLRYSDFRDLVKPRVVPLTHEKERRAA
jgi:Ala-tRNA(Pro) deacylase